MLRTFFSKYQQIARSRFLWIFLILLIVAVAIGYGLLQPKQSKDETKNIVDVTLGDIKENVTAQGKLEPKEFVDVGAQVTGQLQTRVWRAAEVGAVTLPAAAGSGPPHG